MTSNTTVLSLVQRKDESPMTEDDENALLPYASIINLFQEALTSDESTSTLDMVQRKDQTVMTEEDEDALLPYSGLVMLFNMISAPEAEDDYENYLNEADIFPDLERVERKDGSPMTEDDENALLPYSGIISVFAILAQLTGEIDASPTGTYESNVGDFSDNEVSNPFHGITRKDGHKLTQEDNDILMEFGGMIYAMKLMSFFMTLAHESCDPLEEVSRIDGKELDEVDEALLMEFYPAFQFVSMTYNCLFPPLAAVFYPDGDQDLTEFGEQLGEKYVSAVTLNEVDTELSYSAWSLVGNLFIAVYKKTFGTFASPWEVKNSSNANGLKRKPSGAELSAWIGLATQKTFGLDDPSRKVRARAVL